MELRADIEQLLKVGTTICVKPQGYSMYPMLVPGRDSVIIEPCSVLHDQDSFDDMEKQFVSRSHVERDSLLKKVIRRGDVVLYRRDSGILVLHRVFRVKWDEFYTVGDNQTLIEGPLHSGQLRGKLVGFVRRGKRYSVNDLPYRVYTVLWLMLRPFRHKIAVAVHFLKMKR